MNLISGKSFSYTIPETTFIDAEDGNTRSMSLQLVKLSNNFPSTCWYSFNATSQKFDGLHSTNLMQGKSSVKFDFELLAKDSCGLSSMDNVTVALQKPAQACFELSFIFQTLKTYSCEWVPVKMFLDKVALFYGFSSLDFNVVSYSKIGLTNKAFAVKIAVTQTKVRCEPCDFSSISTLTERVIRKSDNSVATAFKNYMSPDFAVNNAVAVGVNSCVPIVTTKPVVTTTQPATTTTR